MTPNLFVCSLGGLLNPCLLVCEQIVPVTRSAYFQLQLVHQLYPILDKDLAVLTHALVMSQVDYCNGLYGAGGGGEEEGLLLKTTQ